MDQRKRNKYEEFLDGLESSSIFNAPFWLDIVTGGTWDVALVEKGSRVIAALPYYIRKTWGFRVMGMPPLTQTLGVLYKDNPQQKYTSRLAEQKQVFGKLIEQLPPFDYFKQRFHYTFANWLPFYWKNFLQTTRYTYVLDEMTDLNAVWSNIRSNIRGHINKAEKLVTVVDDRSVDDFIRLNGAVFKRKNENNVPDPALMKELVERCVERDQGKMFFAVDANGKIHACALLVWDRNTAYYLMSGSDPGLRNSGAGTLLLWHAVQFASQVSRKFDFEGSMIEPVERHFRDFGAIQKPVFQITKFNSKLLKIAYCLRGRQ